MEDKMKYILLTRSIQDNGLITIDEKAKKDFMEMMDWDEKKFKENTTTV